MLPTVVLRAFDRSTLAAAREGDVALGRQLGVSVVDGWLADRDALGMVEAALAAAGDGGDYWGPFFVLDESRRIVGNAGFFGPPLATAPGPREVEIGYAVAPASRRRGIATAAIVALVERAFRSPHVDAVRARTEDGNVGSARALAKAGFTASGRADDDPTRTVHRRARP